jgi:16S rRNA (guanine966-N2)-methyltransferase
MRIIAGRARGRTLFTPKGLHTRPTQDFVRESLFNIIRGDVPGAIVLDLLAGSGALALEALSRGAARAVLTDRSRQAVACIRRNVETLGFAVQTAILQCDWRTALKKLACADNHFSLVFLDPPYELALYPEMTESLASRQLLADGALIVIEHRRDIRFELTQSFIPRDCRNYGDTEIHLYTYQPGGRADG